MYSLGFLEETVLLLVMMLEDHAYGVSIASEYKERTGKEISIPAIHTVLRRLEGKGYLQSYYSAATRERGGRKKRIYKITSLGYKVISEVHAQRNQFWSLITKPDIG